MTSSLPILVSLLAVSSLAAQTSMASTVVNQDGAGCQGGQGRLTGGVVASANAGVTYDAATGLLQLTINNTTPVFGAESTAVITEVHLNIPAGSITSASLTNQTGSGGATPAFTLTFDADTGTLPNATSAGCLGSFNITLDAGAGTQGGIANPAATSISTPNPVMGPVTFDIQLAGPGSAGIDAEAILAATSQDGSQLTNIGVRFDGGGLSGQESGFVGSCDGCRTALYTVGQTAIGQTFDLCVTGGYGCHACVWVSATAGPVVVGPFTIPIGAPLAGSFDLGNFGLGGGGSSFCVTFTVPNDPLLSGFTFYTTNITYNALNLTTVEFAPALAVTIN